MLIPQDIDYPALDWISTAKEPAWSDLNQKEVVDNIITALTSNRHDRAQIIGSIRRAAIDYMLTVQYPEDAGEDSVRPEADSAARIRQSEHHHARLGGERRNHSNRPPRWITINCSA